MQKGSGVSPSAPYYAALLCAQQRQPACTDARLVCFSGDLPWLPGNVRDMNMPDAAGSAEGEDVGGVGDAHEGGAHVLGRGACPNAELVSPQFAV